ncbi:MAG: hypothetical protein AVDCRST_MAG54-2864, partial [uncultured Actinomycetospora sp.]
CGARPRAISASRRRQDPRYCWTPRAGSCGPRARRSPRASGPARPSARRSPTSRPRSPPPPPGRPPGARA